MTPKERTIKLLRNQDCNNCKYKLSNVGKLFVCSLGHPIDLEFGCKWWGQRVEVDGWTLEEVMAREG